MSEAIVRTAAQRDFDATLAEGRLSLQVDAQTGRAQFFPRPVNLHSPGAALEWRTATGEGEVMACTVVRGGPLRGSEPCLFALIRLDEGPRMLALVEGDVAAPPPIGSRVRASVDPARRPAIIFRADP